MRLAPRDPSMHGDHHKCNKCEEFGKYIWKNTHWCKDCYDKEEYPELAHLTPAERQQNRLDGAAGKIVKKRGFINLGNIEKEEKKPATMGF
jgi:hypothetical protein